MLQKKRVTFADWTGRSLASVKKIIPCHDEDHIPWCSGERPSREPCNERHNNLVCLFDQPGQKHDLLERVKEQHVSLEHAACHRTVIRGYVRVLNVAFRKEVTIRFTFDRWETFRDIWADYFSSSRSGMTDQFLFRIPLPSILNNGTRIEFAVRYTVNGRHYWDNNLQQNYCVINVAS